MKTNHEHKSRFRILKNGKIALIISSLLGTITLVSASPTDGVVTSGTASISQTANSTTITQSSNKASINWQSFSVKPNETVNFVQPNSSSVTLNRVVGVTQSLIEGTINANGQVFLLNPNGIVFSKGSSVNVGGLVASTLKLSDEDFQAGNYSLSGNSTNSILNLGTITANQNGYVVLAGKTVSNEGLIKATLGDIHLVGASQVSLNINGNSLIKLTIDKGILDSLVENKGIIQANGGEVYLTTQALDTVLNGVVNNTGIIEANSIDTHNGKIVLFAHGGTSNISGTLDASAKTTDGGFVETSGSHVDIAENTIITTKAENGNDGIWLIDPVDFTIAASGGDMSGTTLSNNLSLGSVVIQSSSGASGTNGDITINDSVTWTSGNTLTLTAYNDIFINTTLNASGGSGGKVVLNYGTGGNSNADYYIHAPINLRAGQNFTTKLGTNSAINYTVITTAAALQNINSNLSGNFALGNNIDTSSIVNFVPLGNIATPFTGKVDGLGHAIDNLTINSSDASTDVGLFGDTSGALIQNLGLTNVDITSTNNYVVGGLVGFMNNASKIKRSYINGGIIRSANATLGVGGFVGQIYDAGSSILESFSNVSIANTNTIQNVGGFVGENGGVIRDSYALGSIDNADYTGGFIGWNSNHNQTSQGTITNSYSNVTITNSTNTGGFDENSDSKANFTNCYFNTATGLTDNNSGVSGLSSAQTKQQSNFSGFDFTNTWIGYDGYTAPLLRAFMVPLTVSANDVTITYNGTAKSANGVTYSIASPTALLLGSLGYSFGINSVTNTSGDHTNAGNVAIKASGNYSTQQIGGYAISFVDGTMTINKKAVSVSGLSAANKTYDGTTSISVSNWGSVSTGVGTQTLTLNHGTASFSNKDVGSSKPVTATGYSLADGTNGGIASNYTLSSTSATTTADITAKALTISGLTADNKVYDGTTTVSISNWGSVSTGVGTETLTLNHGTASFSDKDAGVGKTVTAIGYSLSDGTNAGVSSNYTLSSTSATATADIEPLSNNSTTHSTSTLSIQHLLASLNHINASHNLKKKNEISSVVNANRYVPSNLKYFLMGNIPIINTMLDSNNNLTLEAHNNIFSISNN
jgi:filamentous hemagglutinin family protein